MSGNSPQNELNAKISEHHIYNGYNVSTDANMLEI